MHSSKAHDSNDAMELDVRIRYDTMCTEPGPRHPEHTRTGPLLKLFAFIVPYQILLAASACGNLGLSPALNFVCTINSEILLLLLMLNKLKSIHVNYEHAHDCQYHIWLLFDIFTLAYMFVWWNFKMTFELHGHSNPKWFNMMQSDVREHEYNTHWAK